MDDVEKIYAFTSDAKKLLRGVTFEDQQRIHQQLEQKVPA